MESLRRFYRAGLTFHGGSAAGLASFPVALVALLTLSLTACSDDDAARAPDAAIGRSDAGARTRLEVLDPPGDQLGLAFGQSGELRVRYLDEAQAPISGAEVSFVVATSGSEDLAGATLGATAAHSDAGGVARVTVTAGAASTTFRVEASAHRATPVTFYIVVSDEGFASLVATPTYLGARPASELARIEVRLYAADQDGAPNAWDRCTRLDPLAPPETPYPPRAFSAFEQPARFMAVVAGASYTLFGWATGPDGRVLGAGCVTLLPEQVHAGGTLRFALPVADLSVPPAAAFHLESELDLAPLGPTLFPDTTGFGASACAFGAAQLVLDCAIDALDDGARADCRVDAPGPRATALEAARGLIDDDGCRGPIAADGSVSVDALLDEELRGEGTPSARFREAATGLATILARARIGSYLALSRGSARHTLRRLVLAAPDGPFAIELAATARPSLDAELTVSVDAPGALLTLAEHGHSLRLGDAVWRAFAERVLQPHGLDTTRGAFGAALLLADACEPASAIACAAAGDERDCLVSACADTAEALDALLAEPFDRLDGTALDLVWTGVAAMVDGDADLVGETLAAGLWSARLVVSDGSSVPVTGTFAGAAD